VCDAVKPVSLRFQSPSEPSLGLHALAWGDPSKPLVVLLHGGGANAWWWAHIAPALCDRFRLVALDFRGHGASDHPEELVPGAFDADVEALLTHLDRSAVRLVGHSMGARVALDCAARRAPMPGRPQIRGLAMLDLARGGSKRVGRRARLALALRRSYASREDAIERFRFVPAAEHVDEALRRSIASRSLVEEADGRYGYNFDPRWFGLPSRPRPDFADISCPALLIRGEESTLLPREAAEESVRALPQGKLVEIAGAGHHVHLDRPGPTIDALREFLGPLA